MPAEWHKHASTWLAFPHNKNDWPTKFTPIAWVFAEIAKQITKGEILNLIVKDELHKQKAILTLTKADVDLNKVNFVISPSDRGWMRDCGACFVIDKHNSSKKIIRFGFNAWAKYDNYKLDKELPKIAAQQTKTEIINAEYNGNKIILEGGAIDTNGLGTIITTEECLLDTKTQVRNIGFNAKDYENIFEEYLGAKNTIWLNKGIAGDDTHGHVDDLCRFVNEGTIVLVREKNQTDANYKPLEENWERIQDVRLENGLKPNVVELPMPSPLYFDKVRLPASYANFYISNHSILVPTFNDANDRIALNILSELFPNRSVVGIHAVDLVWGLGTVHCLTREEFE